MNWRERFSTILTHKEPDRIPLDVWKSPAFNTKISNELSQEKLATLSPDLWLGTRNISPGISEDFKNKGAVRELFIHQGTGIWVDDNTMEDEWGVRRRLTATGTESRIVHHPLKDANMNSLDDYPFPNPYAPGRFAENKEDVKEYKEEGYWTVGTFVMDAFWCQSWFMRGFTQMTVDLYSNPEFVEKLLDNLLHFYMGIGEQFSRLEVDQVNLYDDVAAQTGMIVAPKLWRKYFKPRYQKLIGAIKPRVKYIFYHSDGDIRSIIPDLIEVGVNILNPIQPDCMDPAELKRIYGERLTFWGGLSVQDTIPHGTVDDVKGEVKRTIQTCAPEGGFVLGTSNLITQDTPIENCLAIYEAAKKYAKYPLEI
jgi:uroporphyrinogen decarboxylase